MVFNMSYSDMKMGKLNTKSVYLVLSVCVNKTLKLKNVT